MTEKTSTRRFSTRGFTSFLLTLTSIAIIGSGLVLYFTPQGRVAHWNDWRMLGLDKDQWSAVHINCALLFLVISGVHLYLNWSIFWRYLRDKRAGSTIHLKRELVSAVVIGVVVVAGTLLVVPPFSTIMNWNEQVKDYWAQNSPRPPYSHAESSSIKEFARRIGVSPQDVSEALRQEGFPSDDMQVTVGDLAHQAGVSPSDVFKAVKKHFPDTDEFTPRGRGGGRGRGRGRNAQQPEPG